MGGQVVGQCLQKFKKIKDLQKDLLTPQWCALGLARGLHYLIVSFVSVRKCTLE